MGILASAQRDDGMATKLFLNYFVEFGKNILENDERRFVFLV